MEDLLEWLKNVPNGYEIKKVESIGRHEPLILINVQETRDEQKRKH